MKLYTFIIAFILGVILTVFSYQAYTIYTLRGEVATDHATLTQVVSFLNSQLQAAQQQGSQQQAQAQQQVQQTAPTLPSTPSKK